MRRHTFGFGAALVAMFLATSASAGTITITNSVTGNFDGSSGSRGFTVTGLEVGYGTGIITDVDIAINFAKADGEDFDPPYPGGTPFYNEIIFALFNPTAVGVNLIAEDSWESGSGQFDGTILFDQAAADVVNFGAGPVAGTYRPTGTGSLADYIGLSASGLWSLYIEDTTGADSLRFREATLTITTSDVSEVPEPGTLLLVGGGFVAAAAMVRRRKAVK